MDVASGVTDSGADRTTPDDCTGFKGAATCEVPWLEIVVLATRIDPDRSAVREWFFETPIWPYGKTACKLVQAGRSDVVIAFLEDALRDASKAARSS